MSRNTGRRHDEGSFEMTPVRRVLDAAYATAAGLAALSLLLIFAVMMAQMGLRAVGVQLPAADDVSAYLCVATTFFALAATFKRGELIRVGMALERLTPSARRWAEVLALSLAAAMVGYIVFWTAQDTLFSWEIEEFSQGTAAIPIWVPKLAMPVGAGLLLVAVLDELLSVLRGNRPAYVVAAEERAASGDFSAEV
jgi:TRAP-type C4-dicarboxylate transport system permease small subunit